MRIRRAYVFVECAPGQAARVAGHIRKNPAVVAADVVTGPSEVIAILEAPNTETLARIVLVEIAGIAGVRKTATSGVLTENYAMKAEIA